MKQETKQEEAEKPPKVVVSIGENRGYNGKTSRTSFYISDMNTAAAEEMTKEMMEKLGIKEHQQ